MDMQIDINKVLELYKQRVSDLEYEIIVIMAKCSQLEEELLKEKEKNNNK